MVGSVMTGTLPFSVTPWVIVGLTLPTRFLGHEDSDTAHMTAQCSNFHLQLGFVPQGWSSATLTHYIQWVKARFSPVITEDAEVVLQAYYQQQRHDRGCSSARATVRLLESLVRVAQVITAASQYPTVGMSELGCPIWPPV